MKFTTTATVIAAALALFNPAEARELVGLVPGGWSSDRGRSVGRGRSSDIRHSTGVVFRGNGDVIHPRTGVVFRANGDVIHTRTGAYFSKDEDTDDLGNRWDFGGSTPSYSYGGNTYNRGGYIESP